MRLAPAVTLAVLLAPRIAAAAPPGQKDVPFIAKAVQLGGAPSQLSAPLFTLSGASTDNTATFYAAWDDQSLYLGVEVKDSALHSNAEPADAPNAWNNDGVELNFDLKNKKSISQGDKDFRQWIFPLGSKDGDAYDAYGTGAFGDTSFKGNAKIAYKLEGTLNDAQADVGYSAVVQLPWTDLALQPANNLSFGFDPAINDRDASGDATSIDWAGIDPFSQPALWGSLRLVGKGQQPPAGDGKPSPSDGRRLDAKADGKAGAGSDAQAPRERPKEGCGCSSAHVSGCEGALPIVLVLIALVWLRSATRSRDYCLP
jgi:hypothetical protein